MKQIPLAIITAICFSSCSVEYITQECDHDHDKVTVSTNEVPKAQPVQRTRETVWEEPKVTRVRVEPVTRVERPVIQVRQPVIRVQQPIHTTRVIYNTTPVVRSYNYTPPVVYSRSSYSYSRNCAPVIRTNCSSVLQMQIRPNRYKAVSRYCPQRGWHFVRF